VLAATYTSGLILAGNLAGDILNLAQKSEAGGDALSSQILHAVYYVIPDLADLSLRPEASNALDIPKHFLEFGTLYGLSYAAIALVASMWVFSRKKHV